MQEAVFTIGHSTHPQERFIALLLQHGITAICDVRSKPYSRMSPQFNREELKHCLRESGIAYVFQGEDLGARSGDPACYENGRVQYDRLAQTNRFRQGLDRLREGMREYRVAIMCAEKEPLECHRTILIARHLAALGVDIEHIHADGSLESHAAALSRLAQMFNLEEEDLFLSHEERMAEAYSRQEKRIAFEFSASAADPQPEGHPK